MARRRGRHAGVALAGITRLDGDSIRLVNRFVVIDSHNALDSLVARSDHRRMVGNDQRSCWSLSMLRLSGGLSESDGVRLIVVTVDLFDGDMQIGRYADFAGEPLESWLARRHHLVDVRKPRLRASGR